MAKAGGIAMTALMDSLTKVRKTLGYQKWYWFQGGRADVAYHRMVERLDDEARKDLALLKPIPVPQHADIECCMLCGHKQAAMAAWALWSLLRFSRGNIGIAVHSDGRLTTDDKVMLGNLFPGVIIRDKEEIDRAMDAELPRDKYPCIQELYHKQQTCKKIAAFHLLSKSRTLLPLDSDILFFREPTLLLDHAASDSPAVMTMRDVMHAYPASQEEIKEVLGVEVPDRLNSGLAVIRRYDRETLDWTESMLAKLPHEWLYRYFMEQFTMSIVATRRGHIFLPEEYRFELGEGEPVEICRHYISGRTIRPRFYTSGIPQVKRTAGL